LRGQIQSVNCSNCGAPIDLAAGTVCTHCKSPLSMIDMKQPEQLLEQLRRESEPKPLDPDLALKLARARREIERLFGGDTG
jgi:predicted amidophosphoribosyltransferase